MMMLKRSGHGHDPNGVAATNVVSVPLNVWPVPIPAEIFLKAGTCLLNLFGKPLYHSLLAHPFVYFFQMAISLDTHCEHEFQAEAQRERHFDNLPLGDGWGHWVESKLSQAYVKTHGTQSEVHYLLPFCFIEQMLINL